MEMARQILNDHVLVRSTMYPLHGVHLKCPYKIMHSMKNKKEELEALALSHVYDIIGIRKK